MNDPRVPPPEALALAFSEPPPLARAKWPELAAGMERLDALRAKQVEYDQQAIRLRENLPAVRARDQAALGEALAGGDPEPELEAAALEAEIERLARNSAAMLPVIAEQIVEVTKLIKRRREGWSGDIQRRISAEAAAYRAAVVALAQARERVVAEVQLGAWVSQFPEPGVQPQTALVPDDPQLGAQTGRSFHQVQTDLLRDAEQLPAIGPVQPSQELARLLGKEGFAGEFVDRDGNRRARWFRRGTARQHATWEAIAQVEAQNDP